MRQGARVSVTATAKCLLVCARANLDSREKNVPKVASRIATGTATVMKIRMSARAMTALRAIVASSLLPVMVSTVGMASAMKTLGNRSVSAMTDTMAVSVTLPTPSTSLQL